MHPSAQQSTWKSAEELWLLLRSSGYQACSNLLQALVVEEDSVALWSHYMGQVHLWGFTMQALMNLDLGWEACVGRDNLFLPCCAREQFYVVQTTPLVKVWYTQKRKTWSLVHDGQG